MRPTRIYESAFDDIDINDLDNASSVVDVTFHREPNIKMCWCVTAEHVIKNYNEMTDFINTAQDIVSVSIDTLPFIEEPEAPIVTVANRQQFTSHNTIEYDGIRYAMRDNMSETAFIEEHILSGYDEITAIRIDFMLYIDRVKISRKDKITVALRIMKILAKLNKYAKSVGLNPIQYTFVYDLTLTDKERLKKYSSISLNSIGNIKSMTANLYIRIFKEHISSDDIPDNILHIADDYRNRITSYMKTILCNFEQYRITTSDKKLIMCPKTPNTMIAVKPFSLTLKTQDLWDSFNVKSDGHNSSITFNSANEYAQYSLDSLSELYKYHIDGHIKTLYIFFGFYDEEMEDMLSEGETFSDKEMIADVYYTDTANCTYQNTLNLIGVDVDEIVVDYPFHITKSVVKVKAAPSVRITEKFDSDKYKK